MTAEAAIEEITAAIIRANADGTIVAGAVAVKAENPAGAIAVRDKLVAAQTVMVAEIAGIALLLIVGRIQ
jgi:hypothetical protein